MIETYSFLLKHIYIYLNLLFKMYTQVNEIFSLFFIIQFIMLFFLYLFSLFFLIFIIFFFFFQIVIIFSPRTRVYLLRLRFRLVRKEAVETIVRRSKVGDWFLLYMLGENLDTVIYRDVMHELANKLASRHHHSVPGIKGELQEA